MQFLENLCRQCADVWAIVIHLLEGASAWLGISPLNMMGVVVLVSLEVSLVVNYRRGARFDLFKRDLVWHALFILLCLCLNWCYNQKRLATNELTEESVVVVYNTGKKVSEAFLEIKIPKLRLKAVLCKDSDERDQGLGNDGSRKESHELEDGGIMKSGYERIEFVATLMNVDKLPDDTKIYFEMHRNPDDNLAVMFSACVQWDDNGRGMIMKDSLNFRLEEPVALYFADSNTIELNYLYDTYLQEQIDESLGDTFIGFSAAGTYKGADFTSIARSLQEYSLGECTTANITLPLSIETEDERVDIMLKAQASPVCLDACLVESSILPYSYDAADVQAEEFEQMLLAEAEEALLLGTRWLGKTTSLTSVEPNTPYYLVSRLTLPDYVDLDELDDWTVTLSWYWKDRAAGLLEGRAILFYDDRLYDFAVWDVMVQSEVALADDYPDLVETSIWADAQDSTLVCLSKNFDKENPDNLLFYQRADGRLALLASVLEPLKGAELNNRELYIVMRLAWHEEAD